MLWFEIKKVFSRPANRIVLAVTAGILALVCWLAVVSVEYVNEEGDTETGVEAVRELRSRKMEWAGYLTEDVLAEVIRQNAAVNALKAYRSENIQESNKTYAKKQGFLSIRDLLNRSFCGFREYDYYRADSITEAEIPLFYENRVAKLEEWLESDEAKWQFSEEEKRFLIEQYEKLDTPLYYEYMDGWIALLEYSPSIIMITVLLTGFLVSGIFAGEFQWKADSVFFSAKYGRNRAVAAKVGAGLGIVTAVYWAVVSIYSAVVLGILGTEGAGCPIQASFEKWKSFYNITYFQAYLLAMAGGYIGSLFMLLLCMLVSAKTRSAVLAAAVPFILIFLPSFLSNLSVLADALGVLPDQLLQVGTALNYFSLYRIGGKIMGSIPILMIVYTVLCLVMPPVLYRIYRRAEIK